ncbi:BamA/TamA family outer membrane protein [Pedobacter sp. PLR]|uniref:translocation and assembly module lipoprotein TamL n=1 Tax=Pedobacter sp. PLR TaxID=2994465 RepID=UPI002246DD56|nr:BamA/TamA family outer membrane protein [Pedobacter sp. PLR]MCX2451825.1 BamA/TamA family outer membrane protein [Pedobacter sp. PLR]
MKAYYNYKKNVQFLAILLLIIVFAAGCSSTKYIEPYQSIVKKVEIDSIGKAFEEEAYNYIQKDIRPTSKLGINVLLYNMFNTKDGRYKTSNIKPLGSPPPILDSAIVDISRNQIEKYLVSKGYFNARVKSDIKVKDKKAEVVFTVNKGPEFKISEFNYQIPDSAVKQLYLSRRDLFTHVKKGMRFDDDSLSFERDQIYQLMKENGYYDFAKPYVRFLVDSNSHDSKAKVTLLIDNPLDKAKHEKYKIGETNIVIAPNSDGYPDSVVLNKRIFKGIRYTDLSKKFRRNPIVRYNFLREGEEYNIKNENTTFDRLYELNVFKNVKIDYQKAKDSTFTVNPFVQLIPQKIMSNRVEGEVPFNGGTVGFNLSNTYTNNNLFRGTERFEFQIKGGLQSRVGQGGSIFSDIYQRDFSVSSSLTVPRLMMPFFSKYVTGKGGMPHTIFSTSYVFALQKDFFTRRVFLNSLTYDFIETKSKLHSVTPINFEYRFGSLLFDPLDTTQNIKDLVLNNAYTIKLLTRKSITLGIKYAYSLNADKLLNGNDFIYFRGNIDLAGNMLQGITKLSGVKTDPGNEDFGRILNVPFNQYVRPEVDVRWYKGLGPDKQFVARLNLGVGYAYGNSVDMPFEKLFFAGGSSGVRAWQARTLGPGGYNRGDAIKTPDERRTLYGLDQLGDMHMEANFEYRFKLVNKFFGGKLKGAMFLDMGNVWNISSKEADSNQVTVFKLKNLAKQIAIGTGMGFRYDVQYFVFRFDVGLKLKDPQFTGSDQWVISKFLGGGKKFRDDYDALNTPDRYRFVQYNFGIGMPF